MLEIKFRAWDYDNEYMYDDSQVIIHEGTVFIGRIKFVHQISQDTELMQYTGLKDKNGVEIYEGDIVKILGDKITVDFVCSIIFEDGSFGRKTEFSFIPLCEWTLLKDCEVIGNIYENPELLDTTK